MPKCKSCSASGLLLRLDFDGLCETCHRSRQDTLAAQLQQLEAFRDEYSAIPSARAEANRIRLESTRQAEAIIADARRQAERIVADAHIQSANTVVSAALRQQELDDRAAQIDQAYDRADLAVAEAKDRISALLFSAREALASPGPESEQAAENASLLISALLLRAAEDLKSEAREAALRSRKNAPNPSATVFTPLPPVKFANLAVKGFVAFDVETTGLSRRSDKLVELAGVKYVAGKEVDRFTTLVDPGIRIPGRAVEIHHITDDMVRGAPSPEQAVSRFLDFCGSLPLVAHNADFDIAFLTNAIYHEGREYYYGEYFYGDTLAIARKLLPDAPNHKLGTVLRLLGVSTGTLHRSEADAEGVAAIVLSWLRLRGLLA